MTRATPPLYGRSATGRFIGIAVLALGLVVLVGWHSGATALIQVLPQFVPMQYNAALGFVFAGAGVLALSTGRRSLAAVAGAVAFLVGLTALLEYLFAVDFGIDELFMEHYVTTETSHPGRMAPNSAMCFVLVGTALVFQALLPGALLRDSVLRGFAVLILALGIVALIGYLFDLEAAYGWANLTRMAVHTAIGFVLLSVALFACTRIALDFVRNPATRGWLTAIVFAVTTVLAAALRAELQNANRALDEARITRQSAFLAQDVTTALDSRLLALRRMADRWAAHGGTAYDTWADDANNYVLDQPGLVAVSRVADSPARRWRADSSGVTSNFSRPWSAPARVDSALSGARQRDAMVLAAGIDPERGQPGFVAVVPLRVAGEHDGFLVGEFAYRPFLAAALPRQTFAEYGIAMYVNSERVFDDGIAVDDADSDGHGIVESTVDVYGTAWQFRLRPRDESLIASYSALPNAVAVAGIIIAALLAMTVQFALRSAAVAEQFQRGSARLRSILDTASEGVVEFDASGRTTFSNRAAQSLLEYPADELLGLKHDELIQPEHHDDRLRAPIGKTLSRGTTTSNAQGYALRRDRTAIFVDYSSSPIVGPQGKTEGAVVIFYDVTARRQAEQERERVIAALEVSNRELDEFAYVASHDLKAPLRTIDNTSRWLEEDFGSHLDDDGRENMALLRSRVSRMERLLDDLLEYSRVGRKIDKRFADEVRGSELAKDLKSLVTERPGIKLVFGSEFRAARFHRMPLQQVLLNLIGNAVKHHDRDDGEVRIDLERTADGCRIRVSDDGPGIEAEYHEKVFKLFTTLKPRDQVEGSGMGLAIVKKHVDNLGGTLTLRSTPGEGSVFEFTWPVVG